MSDRKESSSKKRTKEKNPLPPNPPSPTAEANAPRAKKTAEQPQTNAKATALPFQGFVDDDDADQPPELRFKARVLRRGHDRDPEMLIRNIRKQLEKADVTFAEFLEFDAVRSTGTTFTNPDGYYVALAKELALRKRRESLAAAYKPAAEEQAKQPDIERNEKGNCAKCGGSGQFKDGTFCGDCPTGRDLSRIAQRKRISRIAQRKSKPETSARRGAA